MRRPRGRDKLPKTAERGRPIAFSRSSRPRHDRLLGIGATAVAATSLAFAASGTAEQALHERVDCSRAAAIDPEANVIRGTNGSDRLVGTPGDDVILGLAGNDKIIARGGNDVILAGPGNDVASGNAGNDIVCGEAGRDKLGGNGGSDQVDGGPGADRITSGPGGPLRAGGLGGDLILGQGGPDRIVLNSYAMSMVKAGPGNDTVAVLAKASGSRSMKTAPVVRGDGGNDVMSSGPSARGIYRFLGGSGNDEISGGNGVDIIDLGSGRDVGRGFGGNDDIRGGSGNDRIFGQAGVDRANGGGGTDFCRTSERVSSCEI